MGKSNADSNYRKSLSPTQLKDLEQLEGARSGGYTGPVDRNNKRMTKAELDAWCDIVLSKFQA